MCNSPISIKNPNYGLNLKYKDTKSQMIRVPCGYCEECIANKQMQLIQRIQMESLHNHLFFCTLTYSDKTLPFITTSTGYDIRYADVRDFQLMVKRLRVSDSLPRSFRYFGVTELGFKRGRPHMHSLFLVPKFKSDTFADILNLEKWFYDNVLLEWRRNIGTDKFPSYVPLCQFRKVYTRNGVRTNYDLHYVNPSLSNNGVSDVGFYVLKYMLKPSDRVARLQQALRLNLPEDEYESVWRIVRPRSFKSLHFGDDSYDTKHKVYTSFDVEDYVRKCVERSKSVGADFPQFYNPIDGKTFPLSRYYRNKFFTTKDLDSFPKLVNPSDYDDDGVSQLLTKENHYEKIRKMVDSRDFTAYDSSCLLFSESD